MKRYLAFIILSILLLGACKQDERKPTASGTFETEETIVSTEASGMLREFPLREGQLLQAGEMVGHVDSMQLFLRKKQLLAQVKTVLSRKPEIAVQTASLQEQFKATEHERKRVENMVKVDAATPKQLDDITAQVEIIRKQISAQNSTLNLTSGSITAETSPLKVQIEQLEDQLSKCRIVNPVQGTVLTKYASQGEIVAPGKPLYEIADLSTLILRAYITGDQFPGIAIGKKVKVLVDNGQGGYQSHEGLVEWIADRAEFTPKTIQTKDERANLVYAVKIKVKNNGQLKIGMYGEVEL